MSREFAQRIRVLSNCRSASAIGFRHGIKAIRNTDISGGHSLVASLGPLFWQGSAHYGYEISKRGNAAGAIPARKLSIS